MVAVTAALGVAGLGLTVGAQAGEVAWFGAEMGTLYCFAVLLIGWELWPLAVVSDDGRTDTFTLSTTFAVALVLSGPLLLAMLAQGLSVAYDDVWRRRRYLPAAFNVAQYLAAMLLTRYVYCALTGYDLFAVVTPFTPGDIVPALVAGGAFMLVNGGAVALVVAAESGVNVVRVFTRDPRLFWSATAILIALAPVIVVVTDFSLLMLPLAVLCVVGVQHTAALAARRQLDALHDGLTGLPNRTLAHLRALLAIDDASRTGGHAAVLLVDLDHFKAVNDTLGHPAGDELLREVARRIGSAVPPAVTVARLGGDEFAVVVPGVTDVQEIEELAGRLVEELHEAVVINGARVAVRASIGIAVAPAHGVTVDDVFGRADIALYRAKETGGVAVLHTEVGDTGGDARLDLVADLHAALETDQLVLTFQPVARAQDGAVVALQARLRWPHPTYGDIPPDRFTPLAENAGILAAMTQRAVALALATAAETRKHGHDLTVTVPLPARLLCDLALADDVAAALRVSGVPPSRLTFEVTEHALAAGARRAEEVLAALRDLGVGLSLAPCGRGPSCLCDLDTWPPTEIRVDEASVARPMSAAELHRWLGERPPPAVPGLPRPR